MRLFPLALLALAAPAIAAAQPPARVQDRYGPPAVATLQADAAPASYLSWTNKKAETARAQQPAPDEAAARAPQPQPTPRPQPTVARASAAPAQAPSIYAPPVPQLLAGPPVQAPAPSTRPRLYSVAREFGMQPDAPPPPPIRSRTAQAMILDSVPESAIAEDPEATTKTIRRVTDKAGQTKTVQRSRTSDAGSTQD
ncbi:hypothetical protein BH11PSE2_BH11PSE2_06230 [soil metagenome]